MVNHGTIARTTLSRLNPHVLFKWVGTPVVAIRHHPVGLDGDFLAYVKT